MPYAYLAESMKATAAKAGTAQAKRRPVTLTGTGTLERVTLTDAQGTAFRALSAVTFDQLVEIRRAYLAKIETRRTQETGRVSMTPEALAAFRADVEAEAVQYGVHPRVHAAAVLASGIFVTDGNSADETDDVLDNLFGAEPEAVEPEAVAKPEAKPGK